MRTLKQPYGKIPEARKWGATGGSPWETVSTPVSPSDDAAPADDLTARLMRELEPELPSKVAPGFPQSRVAQ